MVRKATETDLPVIIAIYAEARQFMRDHGNMNQWVNGYPALDILKEDIGRGELYAMVTDEDRIYGVFMIRCLAG